MDIFFIVAVLAVCVASFITHKLHKKHKQAAYLMPYEGPKFSIAKILRLATLSKRKKEPIASDNSSSLLILNLYSPNDHGYGSYDLLQALTSAGLRFGEMNIFHRYTKPNGEGKILFSLASITTPGTIDVDNIGDFFTPGLTLFAEMDKVENPLTVFDLMIESATQLVDDLGGTLYEGRTTLLTNEAIDRIRDQLYNQYMATLSQ